MAEFTSEIVNVERLRSATDPQYYELGTKLYNAGRVTLLKYSPQIANFEVRDPAYHPVEIRLTEKALMFKCDCRYAQRARICEHEVAAFLALKEHVRHTAEPPEPAWKTRLTEMIRTSQATPRRTRPASYLLLYSLQGMGEAVYNVNWKIVPYQVPLSAAPPEFKDGAALLDPQGLYEWIADNPQFGQQSKTPYSSLNPLGCINATREDVSLANVLIERGRAYSYYYVNLPLEDYLPIIASGRAPVFRGDIGQPFQQLLRVLPQPGQFRLHLGREDGHLRLSPRLVFPAKLAVSSSAGSQLGASLLAELETASTQVSEADLTQPLAIEAHPELMSSSEVGAASGPTASPANAPDPEADIVLDLATERLQVVVNSPLWLLSSGTLFQIENETSLQWLGNFMYDPNLVIESNEDEFQEKFLLELAQIAPVDSDLITWESVQAEPQSRIYLNEVKGELQVQLRFGYADLEVVYDPRLPDESLLHSPTPWTLVRVKRQPDLEEQSYKSLSNASYGLKRAPLAPQPGMFSLRARVEPVDFLLHYVPRLVRDGFTVFGEDKLKTARVNRNKPTLSFNISSGIDWFDVQAVVNFGEIEVSFKEVRRLLRKKQRYVKLADGTIGEIPEEWIDRYKHLLALGEENGEALRVSQHHLTLLDGLLDGTDGGQVDAEFERRRERLYNFKSIEERPLPQGFTGELRPYQKAGYDWLHFLRSYQFGGCLADDMGLGKTVQVLVFLQSLYENRLAGQRASLIVVPRSLLVNWQREAARFTPSLHIHEYFDATRDKDLSAFDQYDVIITTYGVMLRDVAQLRSYTFHYAILDESQAIKNPASQTAKAARLLLSDHRLVLTGTPVENSTIELWSQFSFLNPGLLGSQEYFKTEFAGPIERRSDEEAARLLRQLVYPFILRRTKDQVAPELPPRTERLVYSDMEPAQRKLYNRTRDYYRGLLMGMMEKEGLNNSRMKILEGLLRLRQISNHPLLVDDKFRGESGKFDLLVETLETLLAEKHKALVFSQFVQMLHIIRNELDARGIPYEYLDGQTQDRQERVDHFQSDDNIPFFLISLKAGGQGLNLTAADYVIHVDPWWNPAVEMQATDRTHRIGQEKPVFVYKLIARDSVEEKLLQLQERKKNLVEQIITTESSFFKSLTPDDVQVLFS